MGSSAHLISQGYPALTESLGMPLPTLRVVTRVRRRRRFEQRTRYKKDEVALDLNLFLSWIEAVTLILHEAH